MLSKSSRQRRKGEKIKHERIHCADAGDASETGAVELLPARLCHAGDEPRGSQFTKNEPRNFETPDERAPAAADLAAVHHACRAGIARQLRKADVILIRFELGAKSSVLFHRLAFAIVAINPGGLRHKGMRKLAENASRASRFVVCDSLPRNDRPARLERDCRHYRRATPSTQAASTLWHAGCYLLELLDVVS